MRDKVFGGQKWGTSRTGEEGEDEEGCEEGGKTNSTGDNWGKTHMMDEIRRKGGKERGRMLSGRRR